MFSKVGDQIERYMDLLSARQKLVSGNIANADTPGYQTKDIDFQQELRKHLAGHQSPETIDVGGLTTKHDGNNVDLDREARLLSENAIRFSIASQLLKSELRSVKAAVQDGKA